nr:PASTA domain-containing protein [Entomospira culicis]
MLVLSGVTILSTSKPKDETIVPRVVGISLSEAMLLLQNSDLKANITTRFVEDEQFAAGLVLEQRPLAGSYRRVNGEPVELTVSAGLAITTLEDFIGMRMEDVRTAIVSRYNGLITIKEPLIYLSSQEPLGTIIGQDPKAGEPLSGPVAVSFLVSRGMVANNPMLTAYEGLAVERVLIQAGQNNLPFHFIIEGEPTDGHPVIVRQEPPAGSELESGEVVRFYLQPSSNPNGMILGTREVIVPEHATPIKLEIVALREEKEELLLTTYQQGVSLIFAYYQPAGTQIIVRVNGQEQGRIEIN